MKVSVKLDYVKIRDITEAQKTAASKTAEKLMHDIIQSQTIPFQEGTLQNIQTSIDRGELSKGRISIVHDTPYARRLYYNPQYKFSKVKNKLAGGLWWEPWLKGDKKEFARKIYAYFFKKDAGIK